MTQTENSSYQSVGLNQEECVQLDNFFNLLVDLKIIDAPLLSPEADNYELDSTKDIELLQPELVELEVSKEHLGFNSEIFPSCLTEKLEEPVIETTNISENIDKLSSDTFKDPLKQLQEILLGTTLADIDKFTDIFTEKFEKLEQQIYEPQKLINLLLPTISEILRLKIAESKEEMAEIIAPIIDEAIRNRTQQNKTSMGSALASVVPVAISQQILIAPKEVSDAIAPAIGQAIKKQIELEANIVVDALYPIIGSTISKYMAETIRTINEKVEETISLEGIKRKIRAKLQGVSEAELIIKEAIPFTVQAIFLIHKTSGLIISDIQVSDEQRLESEMLAGMLTAIRSFANDCIIQSGSVSELDGIDYGRSKIILEVAGYCYLAIVVQGEPPQEFILKMRQSLGKIIIKYSDLIENFDGNPDTIPTQIHTDLEALKNEKNEGKKSHKKTSPLLLLSATALSVILIPWGIWQYHSGVIRGIENKTAIALASTPELSVYRLNVQVENNSIKLTGRVPNSMLSSQAEEIAKATAPKWVIKNQIFSIEIPADPVLAASEVKRVTTVLNQMDNMAISAQYIAGKVSVEGTVNRITDAQKITQAFEQIPGVKVVSSAVQVKPLKIEMRFYFEPDSASFTKGDLNSKITQTKLILEQYPQKNLKIIGYSYSQKNPNVAQKLALARAKAVEKELINYSVDPSRLKIVATTNLPPGVDTTQQMWLSRTVILELIDN